ncbi:hypothetical protein KC953_02800 [Candidatus Saccharibacteria bacterium]|nr:hypothetical protein [Candidatus Saccharibacteria bacterium]
MTHPLRIPTENQAPIEWSTDKRTVEQILVFCQVTVSQLRRQKKNDSRSQSYKEALLAILERIYGNLSNVNYRAYPAEISFETVAMDLTRGIEQTTPDGQSKVIDYLLALEHEWCRMRDYFKKHFPKRQAD